MPARQSFSSLARPSFVVDWQSVDRDGGHQIDWTAVGEAYRETKGGTVTVGANAAASATSITVAALLFPLPSGAVLYFGGEKVAKLTAAAALGATTLAVEALPNALVTNDVASFVGSGLKTIIGGTVMWVQADGEMVPAGPTAAAGASGLLIATAVEGSKVAALSGHGLVTGGVVFENMLPEATGGPPKVLPSAVKTALAAAGASKGFLFRQYADTRAS